MSSVLASTLATQLSEAKAAAAKAQELTAQFETARVETMKGLHASLGFESSDQFIKAYMVASGARKGGKTRGAAGNSTRAARASITPEKRKEFIARLKKHNDEKTALEWAQEFGVSVATIQNLRDEAGVTEKRT